MLPIRGQMMLQVTMGEPEPERRRQTKQKLRRPQGAGIWPEAVPRTEGPIRIMTFLDSPRQVVSEKTIKRKNHMPMRNAVGNQTGGAQEENDEPGQLRCREGGSYLPLRGRAHLDQAKAECGVVRNGREDKRLSELVSKITLAH